MHTTEIGLAHITSDTALISGHLRDQGLIYMTLLSLTKVKILCISNRILLTKFKLLCINLLLLQMGQILIFLARLCTLNRYTEIWCILQDGSSPA